MVKDFIVLNTNLKTVVEIQLSKNKVCQGIIKDALLFSKTTWKLNTANDYPDQFHEKCFGTLAEIDMRDLEIKELLKELLRKHNQLYKFKTRGNLKTNSRQAKEGRTKARTTKIKRKEVNINDILSSISSSYKSTCSGVLDELDLSRVQLLTLRQVKWIKCTLESGKLAEAMMGTFLQNLKLAIRKVIAKATKTEEAASSDNKESNEEESGNRQSDDQSSSDQDRGDDGSIDEVEELEELMTVEQAGFMGQYRSDFFGNL